VPTLDPVAVRDRGRTERSLHAHEAGQRSAVPRLSLMYGISARSGESSPWERCTPAT
jgi:hypothetical protein